MATRVRWLGHAALHVESDGTNILIDPFFTGNPAAPIPAAEAAADVIIVSHGHGDHLGDTIQIAGRTGATVISNYEIAEWLKTQGVKKVHGQQHGGGFKHPFGYVKLTVAFHGSALPDGSYGGNPAGIVIKFNDGKTMYDAADTALFGDMALIGDEGLDLATVPIGDNFTMGPRDAVRAVGLLRPRKTFPIHYNTWPLIAQDAAAWAARVTAETGVAAHVLAPGDWIEV